MRNSFRALTGKDPLAGIILILLVLLMYLADDGSNAGSGSTADDRALEAVAKERAKRGSACSSDKGALSWPDAALIVLVIPIVVGAIVVAIIPAIVMSRIVVVPASAAVAHSSIERGIIPVAAIVASIPVPIPILSADRKQAGSH